MTTRVGLAALGASVGLGGFLLGGGALIATEEGIIVGTTAFTIAGLTADQLTKVSLFCGVSSIALATILGVSVEDHILEWISIVKQKSLAVWVWNHMTFYEIQAI